MVNTLGVWGDISSFKIQDALVVSAVAILVVFSVLAIIIFITWLFQKGIETVEAKTHILPKEENKLLDEDEDAAVAMLIASIEYYKETGLEPEIKSISKIGD